ncbi:hypothetical protein KBTX_00468 [wastewater metagenome]|uniref:Tripartite ATP-independent periplasmic transporters DctQ component domain-containing protein n=3 Tax=root TaxID=1 RepID=A0A5B8RBL5_9ZZZZ|nr:TRAP transporter small permease [Arhodomonas aquaeolei]MCS4504244.1 TRAP transporter small permease [Arhodomonas aquaeolei]QEA04165.1 hypothetical protein KBTEX_00468 [uncultured organism]
MYRYLDGLGRWLVAASSALGAATALVMIGSLLLGVFYRYVLGDSLVWSGEVALLAFTWTVFLFASALVRDMAHVRVTLLVESLPGPASEVLERLIVLLVLTFGLIMLWTGWNFALFTANQVSPAMRYPLWLRNAAMPVGGALIAFHAAVLLLRPTPIRSMEGNGNG